MNYSQPADPGSLERKRPSSNSGKKGETRRRRTWTASTRSLWVAGRGAAAHSAAGFFKLRINGNRVPADLTLTIFCAEGAALKHTVAPLTEIGAAVTIDRGSIQAAIFSDSPSCRYHIRSCTP